MPMLSKMLNLLPCTSQCLMQARSLQAVKKRSRPASLLNFQWMVAVHSHTPPNLSVTGNQAQHKVECCLLLRSNRRRQQSVPVCRLRSQNGICPFIHIRGETPSTSMEAVRRLVAKLHIIPHHFNQPTPPPPFHRVIPVGALRKWHLPPSLNLVSVHLCCTLADVNCANVHANEQYLLLWQWEV